MAVAFAKGFFILVGLFQTIALKAILGLDAFGALSSALAAATRPNPVDSITPTSAVDASKVASRAANSTDQRPSLSAIVAAV